MKTVFTSPTGQGFSQLWTEPQNFLVERAERAIPDPQAVATKIRQGKKQKTHSAAESRSLRVGCPVQEQQWLGKKAGRECDSGHSVFSTNAMKLVLGFSLFFIWWNLTTSWWNLTTLMGFSTTPPLTTPRFVSPTQISSVSSSHIFNRLINLNMAQMLFWTFSVRTGSTHFRKNPTTSNHLHHGYRCGSNCH